MTPRSTRAVAAVVIALAVTACGGQISDKYVIEEEPFTLQPVAGSDLKQVTLEPKAVERIGIQVASVTEQSPQLLVPSSALWMDIEGVFWVYTNPAPNVYLRQAVDVIDDDGTFATLASGPAPGTTVVIVGVPELFGTEVGVGK